MNKKGLLIVLFLSFHFLFAFSFYNDNDKVLIEIGDKKITKAEFISVYEKNNLYNQAIDPKNVEEYLDLFINFNLKVIEAKSLGLDTTEAFKNELNSYRIQLAQPYLFDQLVTEALIKEAYDRMKYEIRASHILRAVSQHALPLDTARSYAAISKLRSNAAMGHDFGELARNGSDDPSAKGSPPSPKGPGTAGNSGDLGYFSAFSMVYPFETRAYNTEVGEISKIVRTSFGYHIIKVTDKIPALGLVRAGHIMISVPRDAESLTMAKAENKINEIYKKLLDGEDFVSLVKQFSDDKASAAKDGDIPPFTSNRMLPEVVKAIASITENESYTKPVRTQFGWHIFKLYEKSGIGDYEELYPEIKTKVARDSRSQISQDTVIKRLKEEYDFVENTNLISPFYDIVTKDIFEGNWNMDEANQLSEVLFSFADKHFTQQHFAEFLAQSQSKSAVQSISAFVNGKYADFVNKSIIEYENSVLGQKYPEFQSIMQEYHDGILLFELTDNMVWSKAMRDTLGLKEFFNENQGNYTWEKRIDAVICQTRDNKIAKNLRKEIIKANKNGLDIQQVIDKYNEESLLNVSSSKGLYETKDHPVVSLVKWEKGVSPVVKFDDSFFVLMINEVLVPKNKNLSEVRGIVIADYQNYLESLWIDQLKSKYKIELNSEVFNEIKTHFNK